MKKHYLVIALLFVIITPIFSQTDFINFRDPSNPGGARDNNLTPVTIFNTNSPGIQSYEFFVSSQDFINTPGNYKINPMQFYKNNINQGPALTTKPYSKVISIFDGDVIRISGTKVRKFVLLISTKQLILKMQM